MLPGRTIRRARNVGDKLTIATYVLGVYPGCGNRSCGSVRTFPKALSKQTHTACGSISLYLTSQRVTTVTTGVADNPKSSRHPHLTPLLATSIPHPVQPDPCLTRRSLSRMSDTSPSWPDWT